MNKKKTLIVIPARMNSSRFPAKVIANLCGKPMIQWVYENAKKSIADEVIIATDAQEVIDKCQNFTSNVIMTSDKHPSGTDRIYEVIKDRDDIDIVINVQGDEPLIPVSVIDELIRLMQNDAEKLMATVIVPKKRSEIGDDPNRVKVVIANNGKALYFSRANIPFLRKDSGEGMTSYLHWGIYGYRPEVLEKFVGSPEGNLEKSEKLEQLRAMENGIEIFTIQSNLESIGVDTEEDLTAAENKIKELGLV
ncbi:3-deoxy-manno-octulosonate cytidylyltransferase [Lentisphaerota bacterium WC36G]|nr:3-deoxy-manno-octulosonate cytidylyltransferase [Lentisphaerae bacterium WC36]